MYTTTGDSHSGCGDAGRGPNGTGVYNLAASNGDVDWEFLEPLGRKG